MQTSIDPEQQKKEFQLALSKFAHEIRNPLALIQSEMQMMASSHPEITACEEWEDIIENLEYIVDLLDELRKYNNAEQLSLKQTDPAALLKNVTASFRPSLEYLGIILETDIPEQLPCLLLDRTKIRQALLNLLRNAQEAISHSHGIIRITAVPESEGVRITISDNGCGMTKLQQENAFQPFTTYKLNGTGLGLSITRQIIEAHGGQIEIQSTPNKGTVFQIFLRG